MELKVNAVSIPEQITFNYEELKAQLLEKVKVYESMVYSEDQIKLAKKDRASLNALKKALNDERIRREKEYMLPFNQFKSQIQDIIQIIDKPCAVIDQQIKGYEEEQKKAKLALINEYWNSKEKPDGINLEQILDSKWLNASTTMKVIQETIDSKITQMTSDLAVIADLPEYQLEAKAMYLQTLDLGRSVFQAHRLSELAAQQKARQAETPTQINQECPKAADPVDDKQTSDPEETAQERQWIAFQAYLTIDDAKELGAWFRSHGIKYRSIN